MFCMGEDLNDIILVSNIKTIGQSWSQGTALYEEHGDEMGSGKGRQIYDG